MREPGYEEADEGRDGGYGKFREGSNPSLNVVSWSKPELAAPARLVSSQSAVYILA